MSTVPHPTYEKEAYTIEAIHEARKLFIKKLQRVEIQEIKSNVQKNSSRKYKYILYKATTQKNASFNKIPALVMMSTEENWLELDTLIKNEFCCLGQGIPTLEHTIDSRSSIFFITWDPRM